MPNLKTDLATITEICKIDVAELASKMQLKTVTAEHYLHFALANVLLFDRKQQDYGPHNILKYGIHGVVVRMGDKQERLAHLFKTPRRRKAVNESIADTFRDIHVYGNIALLLEEGRWPTS